jgi:hypothetical protein
VTTASTLGRSSDFVFDDFHCFHEAPRCYSNKLLMIGFGIKGWESKSRKAILNDSDTQVPSLRGSDGYNALLELTASADDSFRLCSRLNYGDVMISRRAEPKLAGLSRNPIALFDV